MSAPSALSGLGRMPLPLAILPIATVLLLLGFDIMDRRVLSIDNLVNILQQASFLAIFAMAQTIVILTRGFDLALGPTVSLVSVGAALVMAPMGGSSSIGAVSIVLVGLMAALGIGWIVGLFNGIIIAFVGVTPFVATLGSFNIAIGLATTLSDGRPVQKLPDLLSQLLYSGTVFGVPAPIIIAVILGLVLHLILRRSVLGRRLYLIGTNPWAATVAGISTRRVIVAAYVLSSSLTALGAMILTARTGSGEPDLGGSLSLEAIAAAVVGGTRLTGGSGGIGTAAIGALFITVLSNGMNLARVNGYAQMVMLGIIVIAGVLLDRFRVSRL